MSNELPYEFINLWPDAAPGSEGGSLEERWEERSPDTAAFFDRAITAVTTPRIALFRPAKSNGCSVLLAPGGGYVRVVWDKEGVDVARWLTGLGVTVGLLIYRLPAEGHRNGRDVPLQDAQRGLRLLRAHAEASGLDPARVGVMGFSAGGHVAASLATRFDASVYARVDAHDDLSARPDFALFGYPVVSMEAVLAHPGSRLNLLGESPDPSTVAAYSAECCGRSDSPESFIFLPDDDAAVPPENGVQLYLALRRAGVPAELHVFREGGHGFGIRLAKGPVTAWTGLCEAWLRHNGWFGTAT